MLTNGSQGRGLNRRTHLRPARHPVPATIPPPFCPFHEQEYLPPPCCWQLNCPEPSVHHCHGAFWRAERLLVMSPLGAAKVLGARARAERRIEVNDTIVPDVANLRSELDAERSIGYRLSYIAQAKPGSWSRTLPQNTRALSNLDDRSWSSSYST